MWLSPLLLNLLTNTRDALRAESFTDSTLQQLQADLDLYLSVPIEILSGNYDPNNPSIQTYFTYMRNADTITAIDLFDSPNRQIDFSRFAPSGHYLRSQSLAQYYYAMMWLSQVDIRLLDYLPNGQVISNSNHLAATIMLYQAMETSGALADWQTLDSVLVEFIGESDNTTILDVGRLMSDAGLLTPLDALSLDNDSILNLLNENVYGYQRIAGQVIQVAPSNTEALARPISFLLLGQRFAIDSYVMSNMTYDRLVVDETIVKRPYPSSLDVFYALGNDHTATYLEDELIQYDYQGNLQAQRTLLQGVDWSASFYTRWMNMLRMLSELPHSDHLPQAVQTSAWADKMLHTQLASWAQLRHDTLLYTKQSLTGQVLCEYPAGYIEPYPEFYEALSQYASAGYEFYDSLPLGDYGAFALQQTALEYFDHLQVVANTLQQMSNKIVDGERFSNDEEAFLRDIVVLQDQNFLCGLRQEQWDGWYAGLYPWYGERNLASLNENNPFTIADIHTNPNSQDPSLTPAGVLHIGTGRVVTQFFIVDTPKGQTIYVGPAMTYYEFIAEGYPPNHLNDVEWYYQLTNRAEEEIPFSAPSWTASFRLPSSDDLTILVPGVR